MKSNRKILATLAILLPLGLMQTNCARAKYSVKKPSRQVEKKNDDAKPKTDVKQEKDSLTVSGPSKINIGQEAKFKATCKSEAGHEIIWDLGDKSRQQAGANAVRVYDKVGTYNVTAVCELNNGKDLKKIVKIEVVDPSVNPSQNPNQNPSQNPNQNPGQNPNQNPNQNPGQAPYQSI